MEAGTFFINISSFWVFDLVNEILEVFQFQWNQKKLELTIKIDSRLKVLSIDSDRGRIKQVLLNLISNAVKFTFQGGILITASISNSNDFIQFWVKDSGIGIKKKNMSKLFSLFSMLEIGKDINPNGWGIGLTVSKKYIERLGGSIWVKSKYNEYTKVYFKIPLILSSYSLSWNQDNENELEEFNNIPTTNQISIEAVPEKQKIYSKNMILASKDIPF